MAESKVKSICDSCALFASFCRSEFERIHSHGTMDVSNLLLVPSLGFFLGSPNLVVNHPITRQGTLELCNIWAMEDVVFIVSKF